MKKHIAFILAVVLCFAFCACGSPKNSAPKDTIDFFGDGFSWEMTIKDAEDYIKKNQVNEAPVEIQRNDEFGFTTVSDDYYFFGFHDKYNGKLVRVSINAPNFEPTLKRWFGEPTSEESILDSPWLEWHGILGGRNTTVTYMGALGVLEFSLDDYWNTAESVLAK